MGPREPTKGNAELTRRNVFSFIKIKLVRILTREALKCNSLIQKIGMFLQKKTSRSKNSLALGPKGLLLLEKCQSPQIPCIPPF